MELGMKDTIRHLVVSGGGETGFVFYGILRETHRQGLWNMKNIISTHGTSIGAMFSVMICFAERLSWEILDDYLYLRPWNAIFNFGIDRLVNAYDEIGILDKSTIDNTIHPLLLASDLSPDITMEEYYKEIGIDIHIYCTNLDTFELIDISYKTHPTWKITEAVYCSCALPILFRPYKKDGLTYLDGAMMTNYPILPCLKMGANPNEILGIQKVLDESGDTASTELTFTNMPDYLFTIMAKLLQKVSYECPSIPYEINVPSDFTSIYQIYKITHDFEVRKNAIDRGLEIGKQYVDQIVEKMKKEAVDDTCVEEPVDKPSSSSSLDDSSREQDDDDSSDHCPIDVNEK